MDEARLVGRKVAKHMTSVYERIVY